jgi:methionyl aminopeptidase
MRPVPDDIAKPDYALTGVPVNEAEPPVRSPEEIAAMRHAGHVAAEVLATVADAVAPNVTTEELDAICHAECLRRGVYPSPLNYAGFPKSICTSVNEVICHGIPDSRALLDGDIVNLDVTVFVGGVHGDVNATFPVGTIDVESARLIAVTRECMELGIAAVRPGRAIREIGRAIQRHAEGAGFSVVRSYVGHGIGTGFHNGLEIPHYDNPSATTTIEPGMTFTIEPMIALGTWRDVTWPDNWTSVTADGRRTAQFEHTLLVTDDGAEILTR